MSEETKQDIIAIVQMAEHDPVVRAFIAGFQQAAMLMKPADDAKEVS